MFYWTVGNWTSICLMAKDIKLGSRNGFLNVRFWEVTFPSTKVQHVVSNRDRDLCFVWKSGDDHGVWEFWQEFWIANESHLLDWDNPAKCLLLLLQEKERERESPTKKMIQPWWNCSYELETSKVLSRGNIQKHKCKWQILMTFDFVKHVTASYEARWWKMWSFLWSNQV